MKYFFHLLLKIRGPNITNFRFQALLGALLFIQIPHRIPFNIKSWRCSNDAYEIGDRFVVVNAISLFI
jgi:hypothetical protein